MKAVHGYENIPHCATPRTWYMDTLEAQSMDNVIVATVTSKNKLRFLQVDVLFVRFHEASSLSALTKYRGGRPPYPICKQQP